MKRALLFALLALALPLAAQKKPLTFESIYDPVQKVHWGGSVQNDFDWLDDSTFLWPRKDAAGKFVDWHLYDVATGKERPLFDRAKLQRALVGSGLPEDVAKDAAESDSLTFDARKSAAVLSANEDLYLYSIAKGTVARLTSAPGEEEEATFSPDGQKVAFLRANDLYVVDLAGRERRLTTDGSTEILNGKLDYVYQEEVYGRGIWKAYWWSPDSLRLAFLQLDERPVPEFTIVDHVPTDLAVNVYDYPQAGDPNPKAKLFVVPASGGARVEVDTAKAGGEILIVNVDWNSAALTYQLQNREQTWLDLVRVTPTDGTAKTLLHETTKAWVDPLGPPVWLPDGSFLWQSERTGYRHIEHRGADGAFVRQLTSGEWEVRELHGADGQAVYFSATERSPLGLDLYRVKLDGTGFTRLSGPAGKHGVVFNDAMTQYVDRWSDIATPDQIRVHRNDGNVVRVVEENRVTLAADYDLPKPEFLQVKTRDGFPMEAMLIRPTNFDPAKKYPVYQFTYAGPGAQQVRNEWRGQFLLFHQLIAQQGVIVWIVDNRSASGKGAVSRWPVYKNFGELELRDLEDSLTWLKSQPYIDGSRVLINGWSYGGFMVLYALTHSKSFSAGIAGGTVADWRNYDSIYTERYLLMPQNNPEGYRKSSPQHDLADLHGNLLLLHGTTDDNVHVQNTVQIAYDLQQRNRSFEMMLLPRSKHTVTKNALTFMQKTILEFVRRQLLAAPSQNP
jgi:dipeptidyl-peptidase-4